MGSVWPKAYNSELQKPVIKKGHFSSSRTRKLMRTRPGAKKKKKNTQLQDKSPLDPEKVSVCKGMKNSRFVKYELIT